MKYKAGDKVKLKYRFFGLPADRILTLKEGFLISGKEMWTVEENSELSVFEGTFIFCKAYDSTVMKAIRGEK